MATSSSKQQEVETRVSLVENDISHMVTMFDKLSTSIEKIADVQQDIKQILHVHDERLNRHDVTNSEIYGEIKDMRRESTDQHNQLRDKIISLEKIRWMIIGGGIILTYLATTFDLLK